MQFELTDLFWLIAALLFMQYWWSAKGIKEIALTATRKHCKQLQLQLLDDSIALRGLWLKRDRDGRIRCWRSYNFDFSSTGEDRYQGRIILLGRRIETIDLETHRFEH